MSSTKSYFSNLLLAKKYSLDIISLGDYTMPVDATKNGEKIEVCIEMEILKISLTYDDVTFDEYIIIQKYLGLLMQLR